MTNEQALTKRQELVESGYTIVPDVMDKDLLDRLRTWSDRIFERVTVPHKIRYQGSDIFVSTERRWREGRPTAENRFPDPIAEEIIDQPAQREACRQIGLENLVSDDTVIILSKPGYGPPLYWHQDFMKWQSPEAATPGRYASSCLLPDGHHAREWMPARNPRQPSETPRTARYPAQGSRIRDSSDRRPIASRVRRLSRCDRHPLKRRRSGHRRCARPPRRVAQPDG